MSEVLIVPNDKNRVGEPKRQPALSLYACVATKYTPEKKQHGFDEKVRRQAIGCMWMV